MRSKAGWKETGRVFLNQVRFIQPIPAIYPGSLLFQRLQSLEMHIPKRIVFPDNERSRNTNTPAQVPITTPVWWGQ